MPRDVAVHGEAQSIGHQALVRGNDLEIHEGVHRLVSSLLREAELAGEDCVELKQDLRADDRTAEVIQDPASDLALGGRITVVGVGQDVGVDEGQRGQRVRSS
jgi:hypothetical protein